MRRPALLVALSLCATGVTAGPAAVRAAASTASTASTAGTLTTISSSALRVSVDDGFPRVASYTDIASGAVLYGNEDTLSQVTLNGTNYTPTVSSTVATDHVDYTLTFSAFGNVAIDVTLKVTGNHLDLDVTRIADTTANPVKTLAFPSHNLVSVRSSQTGAALASAKMNTATTGTGDTFSTLTGTTQTDAAPVSSMYAIVNTGQLAASVTSNSYYDSPSGATATENGRVKKQTVDKTSYRRLGIWNGDWLYRSSGSATSDTEPLPWAKVVVTGDRNDDSTVDGQDGAIGYRDIMTSPRGWEKVAKRPVMRIPFNFASQATHPFLQTLDETKRVALNTDGLGQFVLLKGYGSEGHDSAHMDYGFVGPRQGGAADLNTLINGADALNADIGVHINATEQYPVSTTFDTTLNDGGLGWDWLDQSYTVDTRKDGQTGKRASRLASLKAAVPNLDFAYVDVWWGDGYLTRKLARELTAAGLDIATEFPDKFVDDAVWTHWANDVKLRRQQLQGHQQPDRPVHPQPPARRLDLRPPAARRRRAGRVRGLAGQDRLQRLHQEHVHHRPANQVPAGLADHEVDLQHDHAGQRRLGDDQREHPADQQGQPPDPQRRQLPAALGPAGREQALPLEHRRRDDHLDAAHVVGLAGRRQAVQAHRHRPAVRPGPDRDQPPGQHHRHRQHAVRRLSGGPGTGRKHQLGRELEGLRPELLLRQPDGVDGHR